MKWRIQGYGEDIPEGNACWSKLARLEVYEAVSQAFREVSKEDLRVGQTGYATFQTGIGASQCEIIRTE